MALALPVYEVGEQTFDAGIRLPVYEVGAQSFDSGVRLPVYEVGGQSFDSGVRLPRYEVGEDVLSVNTVELTLPLFEALAADHDYAVVTLPQLTLDASEIFEPFAFNTLPVFTIAATVLSNDISITLPLPTLSAQASFEPFLIATLPAPTVTAATAQLSDIGSTLPALELNASVLAGEVVIVDVTLPALSVSADLGASLVNELPLIELAAQAVAGATASLQVTLPLPTAQATLYAENAATIELVLPLPQIEAGFAAGAIATVALTIPALRSSVTVAAGANASIAVTLPVFQATADAHGSGFAQAVVELPLFSIDALAVAALAATYRTWVLNTRTAALTEYQNFNFNSFARFNGKVLAAGPNGIFVLGRDDTDAGTAISASLRPGVVDFGTTLHKRTPRVYVNGKFNGDNEVRTIISEGGTRSYLLKDNRLRTIQQRRVGLGRGPKSRYWQFEFANRNGADFTLHSLVVKPHVLRRRVF